MTEEPPWLTLSEAAERTGHDREALRSRARRGHIPKRVGNRGEWLVQVPADLETVDDRGGDQGLDRGATVEATTLRAVVADLTAEVGELRVQLARAEAERDAARTEAALTAQRELVDELKRLLHDTRRPWWQRLTRR